tara:strand:+ start:1546 stop:1779 length:234 start_codon:yes stop_codon:yes gene_type:complete
MPLYDFKNNDTGEVEEHSMSYKDVDQFLIDNPHLEKMISSPNLISNTGTILSKTSSDWRDLQKRIKKNSGRNNTIRD